MKKIIKYFSFLLILVGIVIPANAQWKTEIYTLNEGWNAIYAHIDASHTTIEQLTQNNEIEEIWMWKPKLSTLQYIQSPDLPLDNSSRWSSWKRNNIDGSPLKKMIGNAAYLVKVSSPINWAVKGKPIPPRYQWTSTGLNFIGFPTPLSAPPVFSNFLNPVNGFGTGAQIFSYEGGPLNEPKPTRIFALNTSPVNRGKAYWMRAKGYNRYYGPFEMELQDWGGLRFGDSISSYKIVLKNNTKNDLVVSMQYFDSEVAPSQGGMPEIKGKTPLILRGDLQTNSLIYDYSSVDNAVKSWTLKPLGETGSSVEIVLGVHWSQLSGASGDLTAGLLYFSDDSNHLQTILPVSATVPDTTGLWVGNAKVSQVRNSMNTFKESFVNGDVKASLNGTSEAPITVSWLKKQAVDNISDGESYFQSDLGYHRIVIKEYSNVSQGDRLWFPTADENGDFLTDPASYWLSQPYHESFTQGWYWKNGIVVAMGNKNTIEMTFINSASPTVPTGYTLFEDTRDGANSASWWYVERDESYSGLEIGDSVSPPTLDENGNSLPAGSPYWQPNGTILTSVDRVFVTTVAGNITVTWRKLSPEVREEKKIQKTVYPKQKLTSADIYTDDMPASVWYIHNPPSKPDYDWVGSLAKSTSGSYQIAKSNNSWGAVANPMELRLIVHNDSQSSPSVVNLLQRVYFGIDNENNSLLIATSPKLFPEATPEVRRVSSVHLPWSKTNQPWVLSGSFGKGATLSTTVSLDHDNLTANPFIHNYHPDHDNLDARFMKKLDQGIESYQIKREITIKLNGSQMGFNGLALSGKVISGEYEEIITLGGKAKNSGGDKETRQYGMKGTVAFRRISDVSNLKTN